MQQNLFLYVLSQNKISCRGGSHFQHCNSWGDPGRCRRHRHLPLIPWVLGVPPQTFEPSSCEERWKTMMSCVFPVVPKLQLRVMTDLTFHKNWANPTVITSPAQWPSLLPWGAQAFSLRPFNSVYITTEPIASSPNQAKQRREIPKRNFPRTQCQEERGTGQLQLCVSSASGFAGQALYLQNREQWTSKEEGAGALPLGWDLDVGDCSHLGISVFGFWKGRKRILGVLVYLRADQSRKLGQELRVYRTMGVSRARRWGDVCSTATIKKKLPLKQQDQKHWRK